MRAKGGIAAGLIVGGFFLHAPALTAAGPTSTAEERKNPLSGDPSAVAQGRILFRQWCGMCHGRDATGGAKGPDLATRALRRGDTDAQLYDTIQAGVPGTQMLASDLSEQETWQIATFLRSLKPPAAGVVRGDAKAGETLFWGEAKCSTCHMVAGRGGRRGPDLSRVGAARPAAFLVESIRNPSAHLTARMSGADSGTTPIRYSTVALTTRDGEEVAGLLVNEDNFSVVLMDDAEAVRSYRKKELRRYAVAKTSLMPAYDEGALSAAQLDDLLAYLDGLRGQ
jgi:cytochrome c oxidase cbb3-type subunit 3